MALLTVVQDVVEDVVEEAASPIEALINLALEEPLLFIVTILLWASAGMFAWWAFIKKEKISPMLLSVLFGFVAIALLLMVFYINPGILDLAQENFIAFIITLAGSAVFGALFLPLILITLIIAITGFQSGS
jgi:hypothetical protein